MEEETEKQAPSGGTLRGRKLTRQLIIAVEIAIAVPIALSVLLGSLAERKALVNGIGESMSQEMVLLSQLVQHESDPVARQRLLEMYCSKMTRHGRPGHYLIVTDGSGQVLASNVDGDRAAQVAATLRARASVSVSAGDAPFRTRIDDVDALAAVRQIPSSAGQDNGTMLYYSEPLAGTYRAVWRMLSVRLVFLGLALLVTFGCLWLMVRRKVSDPLWQLYLGQLDVWKGARGHLRAPSPNNEIGQLYAMHNAMVDKIAEHEKALMDATNAVEAGRIARRLTHDIKEDASSMLKSLRGLVAGKPLNEGEVKVPLRDVAGMADKEQGILRKLADFELAASGSHEVLVEEELHLLENGR